MYKSLAAVLIFLSLLTGCVTRQVYTVNNAKNDSSVDRSASEKSQTDIIIRRDDSFNGMSNQEAIMMIKQRFPEYKQKNIALAFDRPYPEIDFEKADVTIARVKFKSAVYLRHFPECQERVCMDLPPHQLKTEIKQHIAGKILPTSLEIATTAHMGIYGYHFPDKDKEFLIKIYSDGNHYVMPRYQRETLVREINGDFILPLDKYGLRMLRCVEKLNRISIIYTKPNTENSKKRNGYKVSDIKDYLSKLENDGTLRECTDTWIKQ